MAAKKPLKSSETGPGFSQFATGDSIPVANGGVPTGGTTGQGLKKISGTDFDLEWGAVGGSGAVATDAIWDAKGDLAVGTGADTAAKLAVGTDGKQIYADAAEVTGLRWGPSVISPAQITSDQDNYAPTGWANAQIVNISGDIEIRAITSFAETFDGDRKTLFNTGSYPIYIPGEHPDGTADNRVFTGWDHFIFPNRSIDIFYSGFENRWIILTPPENMSNYRGAEYSFVPGSLTAADHGVIAFASSGTGSGFGSFVSANAPAATAINTGTTTTGAATIYFAKTIVDIFPIGEAHVSMSAFFSVPTLSSVTETFTVYFSIENAPSGTAFANNACGIRYTNGVNSGKLEGFSRNNAGTVSTVDLGVSVQGSDYYNIRIDLDKTLTEARFYVDGLMRGRLTANMQSNNSGGASCRIVKSAGTTTRSLYVSQFKASYVFP